MSKSVEMREDPLLAVVPDVRGNIYPHHQEGKLRAVQAKGNPLGKIKEGLLFRGGKFLDGFRPVSGPLVPDYGIGHQFEGVQPSEVKRGFGAKEYIAKKP